MNRSELLDEWKQLATLLELGEGLGTSVVMGRHGHPGIRDRVLDACVGHALAYGLPDRVEPFAAASGTSARGLIHNGGTRDALLRETLGRAPTLPVR